jgi:hypothetical protein
MRATANNFAIHRRKQPKKMTYANQKRVAESPQRKSGKVTRSTDSET